MVLTVVIIAVLLFAPVVHAEECALQDYDTETAPDFMCQGPEEAELLPSSTYPPPIPVRAGTTLRAEWDGALVHRDHLISLGLKLQTVRRLRWLDRRRRAERLEIEERYQEQVGEAEEELRAAVTQQNRDILDLANRRAADATAAASSASAWYRSWTFGFILGFVVSGALVALAAYVGASI